MVYLDYVMRKARDGVRVSGGHLCEAEAPTEATAETAAVVPYLKDMTGLNMLADIGNGTVNIMKINNRKPITTQSYTEKMGDSPQCGVTPYSVGRCQQS